MGELRNGSFDAKVLVFASLPCMRPMLMQERMLSDLIIGLPRKTTKISRDLNGYDKISEFLE